MYIYIYIIYILYIYIYCVCTSTALEIQRIWKTKTWLLPPAQEPLQSAEPDGPEGAGPFVSHTWSEDSDARRWGVVATTTGSRINMVLTGQPDPMV